MPTFIKPGDIYYVPDEIIQLPEARLPASGTRVMHEGRTVLVIQGPIVCDDMDYPVVLVVPVSTKTQYKRELDCLIQPAESGLKHTSVVLTGLVQPVLKSDLSKQRAGKLDAGTMQKIYKLILVQLGLVK